MTLTVQPPGPGVPNYSQADSPGYGAYSQPYSATDEKLPPKSFSMDVLVDARRFAACRETTLRWAFDNRVPVSGKPWGMVFNFFGNHEGAIVPGAFKPVPFDGMKRCDVTWDADIQAPAGSASLLNDTFFKNAKGESVLEFGVFGCISDAGRAWATSPKCKALGAFVSEGVVWSVYMAGGTYVMAIPETPQMRATFNLLVLRDYIKARGLLPAGAIFPSTCVGIEPAYGAGTCRVGLTVNVG